MLVTISQEVQNKLNCLSSNCRKKFLRIILKFINGQLAADEVKRLVGTRNLIRIKYNEGDRIIATIVNKEDETNLRLLDFVSHTEMDQGRYYANLNGDYEMVDLEKLSVKEECSETSEINDEISHRSLWEDHHILTSIIEDVEQDLYVYCGEVQGEDNPDLYLSSEQYKLINTSLPIFLSGSAGSGKTTIALSHAIQRSIEAKHDQTDEKIAYVTYNRHLKQYAERIIQQLYGSETLPNLQLFDYNGLCRKLGVNEKNFPINRQITQQKFIDEFFSRRRKDFKGIDAIALWQEIRHLLKGSVLASGSENCLISQKDYEKKTKTFRDRWNQIYELVKYYQSWLNTHGYWDELDLTHDLLKKLGKDNYQYDLLYCDEIQDLTEIQIYLLLKLLKPPYTSKFPRFFLTGDIAQIINPSAFSWDKLRSILYHEYNHHHEWNSVREILDQPKNLSLNFRSYETIVKLSNEILKQTQNNLPQQSPFRQGGNCPVLISGVSHNQLIEGKNIFGPNNAIITVNEEDKENLVKHFSKDNIKSERILTISEAKGLEYDEVLVWNFFSSFDKWNPQARGDLKELERYKYNCLYVCATRARNNLYFYEEKTPQFWQKPEFDGSIKITDDISEIECFFNPSIAPEDWRKSAQDLESQGLYRQAKENYLRGGWKEEAQRAEAKYQELENNWEEAAKIWEILGEFSKAIEAFENCDRFDEIARIWVNQGKLDLAAVAWEKVPNYSKAAEAYEEIALWEEAERCWEVMKDFKGVARACEKQNLQQKWEKAAAIWHQHSEYEKAAELYEKTSSWKKAEECWRLVPNWPRVAILCEQQEKWNEAAIAWKEAKEFEKAAQICEKNEHWLEAALHWQELSNPHRAALMYQRCAAYAWENSQELEKAAIAYEHGEYWLKAEQLWKQLEQWDKLSELYLRQGEYEKAAQQWQELGNITKAAEVYTEVGDYLQAEKCWRSIEAWEKVAAICERQNTPQKWLEAGAIWAKVARTKSLPESLTIWEKAANSFEKGSVFDQAGEYYEHAEKWREAELCWQKLDYKTRCAIVCEKQGKYQEAAIYWEAEKAWGKAASNWRKIKELEAAGRCYESAQDWDNVLRCYFVLQNWGKVAEACSNLNQWEAAGYAWEKAGEFEKAAQCYEKASLWAKAETCWKRLENWCKVMEMCAKQSKWEEAAQMAEKINDIAKAAEYYTRGKLWSKADICWGLLQNNY